MPRLLLLTPSELSRDPRARRAAVAARARGFEVVGVCGQVSGEEPAPLHGVPLVRVGRRGRLDPLRESGIDRGGREWALLREVRGLYRLARLAVRTAQLVRGGRAAGTANVVHANDLDTLPAGWLLARASEARLVYDAHELYTEFDADPPRIYRAVAGLLEGALARRAHAVATVSEPLAQELVRRLRLRRPPTVVLNAPEIEPDEPAGTANGPLRAVYQGSFGTGRPLGDLLDAVRRAPSVHLTVRAVRIAPHLLEREIAAHGLADRVTVAEQITPDAAVRGLRGQDVGLIFDRPVTLNGELTLPNKLFEYLMAGLAVVVPRLPGLALVEAEGVGVTFEPGRLGDVLEELAGDRPGLAEMRTRARRAALERYNAEAQVERLAALWSAGGR